jgi:hypothetical protein
MVQMLTGDANRPDARGRALKNNRRSFGFASG